MVDVIVIGGDTPNVSHLREMISNPEVVVTPKGEVNMRGVIGSLVAAAALATSPVIIEHMPRMMPRETQPRQKVRPTSNRKDRKDAARRRANQPTRLNRRGESSKLGRRLRRKFELGRAGSF